MAEDGTIRSRYREWIFFGGCRVDGFDHDDGVEFVGESKDRSQTIDFVVAVGRPDSNVIACLIAQVGIRDINFNVETVSIRVVEQVTRSDGCIVRVLCIIDDFSRSDKTLH